MVCPLLRKFLPQQRPVGLRCRVMAGAFVACFQAVLYPGPVWQAPHQEGTGDHRPSYPPWGQQCGGGRDAGNPLQVDDFAPFLQLTEEESLLLCVPGIVSTF